MSARLKELQSVIATIRNEPITAALLLSCKISRNWFSQYCFFCRRNDFVVFLGCEVYFPPFPYFTAGLWKQYLCVCATSPCTLTGSWVQRGNKLCPNRFIIPVKLSAKAISLPVHVPCLQVSLPLFLLCCRPASSFLLLFFFRCLFCFFCPSLCL